MARRLMIQGTMSNVGKSFLTAGLLRIMRQDGYCVAPFKAQNMALNSYITREGLEMGRAQVVQAEAAQTEPTVDMNPVLLKPTTDVGSQVIVHGRPMGNMTAREYFAYKKELLPEIRKSFKRLEEQYEIIVIEGAGSPAEINLKQGDIVNMGFAKLVDAPVLLVGDIDSGGVFAQLYGTVMLLEPEERRRIRGLVINKFRGDKSILEPGLKEIEELCRIPVAGVVPYMNVELEAEDSLSSVLQQGHRAMPHLVDIAVIRFPRLSNFTDFQALSCYPQVSLRYVSGAGDLGNPDLVILPGTKNTIADLLWMRSNGLEAAVLKLSAAKTPVFGICGGYQMMGMTLQDPDQVEGPMGKEPVRGMELLPVDTCFGPEKVQNRAEGAFGRVTGALRGLSGKEMEGYEIHMGVTKAREGRLPLTYVLEQQSDSKQAKLEGISDGNCYGTYIHGIFDADGVAGALVSGLLERKGLSGQPVEAFDYHAYKERQYDRLAEELRRNLDMKRIYEMVFPRP